MRPSPRLALHLVLLLFALAGAYFAWVPGGREFFSHTLLAWVGGSGAGGDAAVRVAGAAAASGPAAGRGAQSGNATRAPAIRAALFNESRRSLMTSDDLAKVDYGLLRVMSKCALPDPIPDPAAYVREVGQQASAVRNTPDAMFLGGDADDTVKTAALVRSIANCRRLSADAPMSDADMRAFRALPGVARWIAMARELGNEKDLGSPAAQAALAQAVAAPMFGLLGSAMSRHVDFSELAKAYPQDENGALRFAAIDLVLCKMGDDCSRGGIVADQLCWQNGICGESVEAAILANLRARGVDTGALNAFVTRVHLGLQAGDGAIFTQRKKTAR